jgi:hypothetical protein
MSCNDFQAHIGPAIDNELPTTETADLVAHLESCPSCAKQWEEMVSVKNHLSRVGNSIEIEQAMIPRILSSLEAERNKPAWIRSKSILMMAAAVLLSGLLAFSFLRPSTPVKNSLPIAKTTISASDIVALYQRHMDKKAEISKNASGSAKSNQTSTKKKAAKVYIAEQVSKQLGFPVEMAEQIGPFRLAGVEINQVKNSSTHVLEICYATDNVHETCIDCFQSAPGSVQLNSANMLASKVNGKAVKIGQFDQLAVIVFSGAQDKVYISKMPTTKLLDLLARTV